MHNLIIRNKDNDYLIRFKTLKTVVTRKHTNNFNKVINRLELHTNAVMIYLYKINTPINLDTLMKSRLKELKIYYKNNLNYLGRGLSKCSDKDKFNLNVGIKTAIKNIGNLDNELIEGINNVISNTVL